MKGIKVAAISILSILALLYTAFLFVLPNVIDLNKYEPQITKAIFEATGIQAEFEDLKLKTSWDLSAGFLTKKVDLSDEKGEKFAQINSFGLKVSLLHLIFKEIKVNKVYADKIMANINEGKREKEKGKRNPFTVYRLPFTFSNTMPAITVNKYRISLISSANNYTIKGSDLEITDFKLNEKIKVSSTGEIILNGRKQILYNISIFSKVLQTDKGGKPIERLNYLKIFDDLYKYDAKSAITANLKINENSDIDGKINFDKLSFNMSGKAFPQSSIKLDFSGNKIKINSSLYTDINSKAIITGFYKSGKNKALDLKIKSDRINLENVFIIANNLLKVFGKKDLEEINAQGIANADFSIKSDFKKVQSSGYLKIQNAKLTNKVYRASMDEIKAFIDFSKDTVQIKEARAKLNSQPIKIEGTIDKSANANILISADNLNLKSVLISLGKSQLIKENDIDGIVDIQANLKGKLDKAVPKVDVIANKISIKNSKANVKIEKVTIKEQNNHGIADISEIKINQGAPLTVSAPKVSVNFDKQNLNIIPTHIYINGIETDFSGKISDLNTNPHLNSINLNIPNQISVPLKGYTNSNITLKGKIQLTGDLENPLIQGGLDIPLIKIPTASTILKNTTLQFGKEIKLNCPEVKIADSNINLSANIEKSFPREIILQNLVFNADNLDLNSIIPIIRNIPKKPNSYIFAIFSGKSTIKKFKIGRIVAENITSYVGFNNVALYLTDIHANAYSGDIRGNISYNSLPQRTYINLQGRGLSASPALIALTGRDDDIHGSLDFDSKVATIGFSKNELLKSLKGDILFIITNGKMGVLGKLEHLIYAQNIVSNSIFKTSLNLIAKAISTKNTGVYKYMKGKISFDNGWANINQIKTSGPSMSLYITGRYYMPENLASLVMLGRISDDVVRVLGPIGDFSVDKAISSIPQTNNVNTFFATQLRTNPVYENTSQIPPLSLKTQFKTKEFKVIIDGDIQKQTSVKSFKWLAKSSSTEALPPFPVVKPQAPELPDFVKKLPDYKN